MHYYRYYTYHCTGFMACRAKHELHQLDVTPNEGCDFTSGVSGIAVGNSSSQSFKSRSISAVMYY